MLTRSFTAAALLCGCVLFTTPAVAAVKKDPREAVAYARYLIAMQLEQTGNVPAAVQILVEIPKELRSAFVYVKIAELQIHMDKVTEAIKTLDEGLLRFKEDDEILFALGKLYLFEGDNIAKAIGYLARAEKQSDNPEVGLLLGRAYESKKDFASAVAVYDRLIAKNPDAEYYFARGLAYQDMGMKDLGRADIEKAAEFGDYPPAMLRLAEMYLERKDTVKAADVLDKMMKNRSGIPTIEVRVAELYYLVGMKEKALNVYESLLGDRSSEEASAFLLKRIAMTAYDIRAYDRALETFTILMTKTPDDVQVYYFAGFLHELKGELQKALEIYQKGLKIAPEFAHIIKRVAAIQLSQRKADDALSTLKGMNQNDRDSDYYRLSGIALFDKKEYKKSAEILQKGLESSPLNESLLYYLAVAQEKLGQFDEAADALREVVKRSPANASALNFLGYLLADTGRSLDEAEGLIDRAVALEPDNPAYLDSKGWVLYRKGKFKEAYDWLVRAVRLAPEEQEIVDHMKAVLEKLGSKETVEQILKGK